MINVSDKVVGKIITQVLYSIIFSWESWRLWDNVTPTYCSKVNGLSFVAYDFFVKIGCNDGKARRNRTYKQLVLICIMDRRIIFIEQKYRNNTAFIDLLKHL